MPSYTRYEDRAQMSEADAVEQRRRGVLSVDPNRSLPVWFDGRYLTASDLNRQQNYLLARQSIFGRSMGAGVIEGLEVALDAGGGTQDRLTIDPGQGIAFDGAHIVLPETMTLNLADLTVHTALDARLGLAEQPRERLAAQSGLYVLSLRAVEYLANPTPSFPTTIDGQREMTMGDRIEAVAATITRYTARMAVSDSLDARAVAAQDIFGSGRLTSGVEANQPIDEVAQRLGQAGTGAMGQLPTFALPLAMISLNNGVVEWIDGPMLRRDLRASGMDFLGLGLNEDQLRLAHFNQYRGALRDVMGMYTRNNNPARFPAEQHFRLLPPAGPLPADAVDAAGQAQSFFPGEMEVELSLIPDDELPALIQESFDLPPIDLTLPVSERAGMSVVILAPVPRAALSAQVQRLGALTLPLRPLSTIGQGPQRPIDRLATLKISLAQTVAQASQTTLSTDSAWASVIDTLTNFGLEGAAGQRTLWYMRRRTLRRNANLESVLAAIDTSGGGPVLDFIDPDGPVPTPVLDSDPDNPELPDTPELSGMAIEVLSSLEQYGDLARIARTGLTGADDDLVNAFAMTVFETKQGNRPLGVVGAVGLLLQNGITPAAFEDTISPLFDANLLGFEQISIALFGPGRNEIPSDMYKALEPFATDIPVVVQFANDIGGLDEDLRKTLLSELSGWSQSQDTMMLFEFAEKTRAIAADPGSVISDGPISADLAALEKELLSSIQDRATMIRIEKVLQTGRPADRETIAIHLLKIGVGKSRISTEIAFGALATGGEIGPQQVKRIRSLGPSMVEGLAELEKPLLEEVLRRDQALIRRVSLMAAAPSTVKLGEVIADARPSRAQLKELSQMLIKTVDDPRASVISVEKMVQKVTGGI